MDRALFKERFSEDWYDKFSEFLGGEDCELIFRSFLPSRRQGRTYALPGIDNVFKTFKLTPLKDLKCIIVGQDPYYQEGVADGLAFSCSNTNILQPSLKKLHEEIDRTVYNGLAGFCSENAYNPDLSYLANQGVLLLNRSLTTDLGKAGLVEHHNVWKPFMKYLFEKIIDKDERHIPVILMGKMAQDIEDFNYLNLTIKTTHPAYAVRNNVDWDCNDCFNKVNSLLETKGIDKISW